jgi:hypothetical protein
MKEVANTKAFELLMDYQSEMIDNSCVLLALSKELDGFIENSPYHPAYNGSIIDLIGGLRETTTSKIIKMIFCYEGEQHDYPLLSHFITTFIGHTIKVRKPIIEAEIGRIDISVRDKSYALIFENKLKNAPFQRNQLARYVRKVEAEGYKDNQIFLIILPCDIEHRPPISARRLPLDCDSTTNSERKCGIDDSHCWCDGDEKLTLKQLNWCKQCDKRILSRIGGELTLHDNFADWLIDASRLLPKQEWPLASSMLQFADYLKGLYSTRFNDKLNMAIKNFLSKKLLTSDSPEENWENISETLDELHQLKESINKLKIPLSIELVKKWENQLKKDFPEIQHDFDNGEYSFGILVQNILIGCWSETTIDGPYWGFKRLSGSKKQQFNMARNILKQAGYDDEGHNRNEESEWMYWDRTLHGELRCRGFYEAARELGYME